MARSARSVLVLALLFALLPSCVFHHHRVGSGAAGIGSTSVRQYYFGFGFWRLNEIDTQRFTEDSVSYDIRTEFAFADLIYSILLAPLTVTTRTVVVER